MRKSQLRQKVNTLPSIPLLTSPVLAMFGQKMYGPNLSETDIKLFVLALTWKKLMKTKK